MHPCYSKEAHNTCARIHLPVAPKCNIGCRYCIRSIDKISNRPGVASEIISPKESISRVKSAVASLPSLTVIGIAGPGDSLANKETFETFELINQDFPNLIKCMSTNGLLLDKYINFLKKINLSTLTVTVNAFTPETASKIYDYIFFEGKKYKGIEAAEFLIEKQYQGISKAVHAGIITKINTVYIPNINAREIPIIAKRYSDIGVNIMNIMPLLPIHCMSNQPAPSCDDLRIMREKCEKYIAQFRLCKQCRSDAVGIPGLSKINNSSTSNYFHF